MMEWRGIVTEVRPQAESSYFPWQLFVYELGEHTQRIGLLIDYTVCHCMESITANELYLYTVC